jgi:hypothetical protein
MGMMKGRPRSTLTALQLLGNSVRGLDWASWKTVYNAVVHTNLRSPGLAFGPSRSPRPTPQAQTAAIRHISGTFNRTTPSTDKHPPHRRPTRLPIKNAALRLCRLPSSSQLKACVVGPWGPPRNDVIPLYSPTTSPIPLSPTPTSHLQRGPPAECPSSSSPPHGP